VHPAASSACAPARRPPRSTARRSADRRGSAERHAVDPLGPSTCPRTQGAEPQRSPEPGSGGAQAGQRAPLARARWRARRTFHGRATRGARRRVVLHEAGGAPRERHARSWRAHDRGGAATRRESCSRRAIARSSSARRDGSPASATSTAPLTSRCGRADLQAAARGGGAARSRASRFRRREARAGPGCARAQRTERAGLFVDRTDEGTVIAPADRARAHSAAAAITPASDGEKPYCPRDTRSARSAIARAGSRAAALQSDRASIVRG